MGTQFTRRTVLTVVPGLALTFLPELPAVAQGNLPQIAADDHDTFLQSLRHMDREGHANMVAWLRGQDHSIFNALADPVQRYCAYLDAADPFCGNAERVM